MGDDEQPAVGPTPDRATWTPRHRSRGGRARKDRPPPEPADDDSLDDDAAAENPASDSPTADRSTDVEMAEDAIDAEGPAVGTAPVPAAAVVVMPTQLLPTAGSTVEGDDHDWLDQEAGPVVRPYTLTGGRSRPFTSGLNLLTHVEALYAPDADLVALQPEQRAILTLTRTALSLAELSARLDLPVGVVRVLVGDLVQANLVSTFEADAAIRAPGDDILQAVIDGLRAL
jgi:hypothetical protein